MKAIIIGGGIGGLTTALALMRNGIDADVFEQAGEIAEVGAGVWVASNAMNVFSRLGIADQIISSGHNLEKVSVVDHKGVLLSQINFSRVREKFGFGTVAIHRADLHRILFKSLKPGIVHTGKKLKNYIQDRNGVTAYFEDGSFAKADLMICADGINSSGRKQMLEEVKIRYSGQTCWRLITNFRLPHPIKDEMFELWGQTSGLRAAYSQINDEQVYAYFTVCTPAGGKDSLSEVKQLLKELCKPFPNLLRDIIDSADPQKIIRNDLNDFKPIKKWFDNRVALLGDAAHATTPNLGQGACQAIEDAFVIADYLSKEETIEMAFEKYKGIRIEKAHFVTNTSWALGKITNTSGVMKSISKAVMRITPASIEQSQIDRLYTLNF